MSKLNWPGVRRRVFQAVVAVSFAALVGEMVLALAVGSVRLGTAGDRDGASVIIGFMEGVSIGWARPRELVIGPKVPEGWTMAERWLADRQNWNLWTAAHEPGYEFSCAGFGYRRCARMRDEAGRFAIDGVYRQVEVPHWPWLIALLIAPLIWLRGAIGRVRRERRARRGLCGRCGYDLRASVGRCPECGEVTNEESGHEAATAVGR